MSPGVHPKWPFLEPVDEEQPTAHQAASPYATRWPLATPNPLLGLLHLQRATQHRQRRIELGLTETTVDDDLRDGRPVSPCSVDLDMPYLAQLEQIDDALKRVIIDQGYREVIYKEAANDSRPGHTPLSLREPIHAEWERQWQWMQDCTDTEDEDVAPENPTVIESSRTSPIISSTVISARDSGQVHKTSITSTSSCSHTTQNSKRKRRDTSEQVETKKRKIDASHSPADLNHIARISNTPG